MAGVVGIVALVVASCGSAGSEAGDTQAPSGGHAASTTAVVDGGEPPVNSGDELRVIVVPDGDGGLPPNVMVGCRAGPVFPAAELDEVPPVDEAESPDLAIAMQSFLGGAEGRFWPQDGWRVLHETEQTMLIVHHDPATGGISFMDLERRDGSWSWAGSSSGGPCPLQTTLPEGLGVVEWRVDPSGRELNAETTVIPVLATELGCASGQPMGQRLLGPEVVMTDSQVLIAFAALPPPGTVQNCQGNPEQPVTVVLAEPLGDRQVVDGLATGLDLADFLD